MVCSRCGKAPKNSRLPRGICSTCAVQLHQRGEYDSYLGAPTGLTIQPDSVLPTDKGYATVMTSAGRMFEHRAVMQASLGRPFKKGENVHHINGIRNDNRLENLELWLTMQHSGQRVTDLIKYIAENHPEAVTALIESRKRAEYKS